MERSKKTGLSEKPSMVRARNPDEKRRIILEVARELFTKQGYEQTTTRQISALTGFSEGIIFHQFGSKFGLFRSVVTEYSRQGVADLLPQNIDLDAMEETVRKMISFCERDRPMFELVRSHEDLLRSHGVPTLGDAILAAIEDRLRKAFRARGGKSPDPAFMAKVLFSIVSLTYATWAETTGKIRKERVIAEGVKYLEAVCE